MKKYLIITFGLLLITANAYGDWSFNVFKDEYKAILDALTVTGGTDGDVLTVQADGSIAPETGGGGATDLGDLVDGEGTAGAVLKDNGNGTYSFGTGLKLDYFILPHGTGTAPTTDGSLYWKTDTDALSVGDGSTAIPIQTGTETEAIEFIIDGGGSAITTGVKGFLEIPFACTITRVTTLADQSGSIAVDLWVDSYANFPPTDADSITSSTPPTLSTAQAAQDSTLTSWTTSLSAGDIIGYNVDSAATVERVTISLVVDK